MDIAVAGADLRLYDNARDVWRISLRIHRYAEMLPQKSPVGGIYGASVDGAQGKCYGSSCWQERDQYSIPFLVFNPSEEHRFMSVQTMAKVFEQSKSKLGDRLVLLAIANHTHEADNASFPSIGTIAREAGLSPRQVQRCIPRLIKLGELSFSGHLSRHGTRVYQVTLGGDKLSGVTNCQGDILSSVGVTNRHRGGDIDVTQSITEHPKENHHTSKVQKRTSDPIPYQAITEAFKARLPMLPPVWKLTSQRQASIRRLWQTELTDLEDWNLYFEKIASSPFLTGKVQPGNGHEAWRANFDFILRPAVFVKVIEGFYHRNGG